MKLIVNKDKCLQNHKCPSITVCPKEAITQSDIYAVPEIDAEKCVLCGKCMKFCPKGAFEKAERTNYNTLVVIGNGFDRFHGVESAYCHFKNYLRCYEKEPVPIFGCLAYDIHDVSKADKERHEFCDKLEQFIDSSKLWSNFEEALSWLDADEIREYHGDELKSYGDDNWKDSFHHDYQWHIENDLSFARQIPSYLKEWILTLDTSVARKFVVDIINNHNLYLNFNYTDVLESIYEIDRNKILYIHGKAKEYLPLIVGHGDNSYFKEKAIPDKNIADDEYPWFEDDDYGGDVRVQEAEEIIEGYFKITYKNVVSIIDKNKTFFKNLCEVSRVYILGHSLSSVDLPYIKLINESVSVDCEWIVSYYDEPEKDGFRKTLIAIGIDEKNIEISTLQKLAKRAAPGGQNELE